MTAPAPTPTPAPAVTARGLLRLAGAVAVAVVAVVLVWQGFGLAGHGTDVHAKRASWALFQALGFGVALVCARGWLLVRGLVALAFLGSVGVAWWTVRSSDFKSAISLREAVAERDRLSGELATATLDDLDRHKGYREIDFLFTQYPSLAAGLKDEHARWKDSLATDLDARLEKAPSDDPKTAAQLRVWAETLTKIDPAGAERREAKVQAWLKAALAAKARELQDPPGDLAAFERTAPGRKTLAEAFPETRDKLVSLEEACALKSNLWVTFRRPATPARVDWRGAEKALLALPALDTSETRFKDARGWLFEQAHDDAKGEVAAHLEAGRYDAAFAAARRHAVEWNASAAALGNAEVKKLDALRDYCEAFAKLSEVSAGAVEVAPPPRPKPE